MISTEMSSNRGRTMENEATVARVHPSPSKDDGDCKNKLEKEQSATAEVICAQDLGHRFGNFHNYYKFHPPSNRLEVLREMGVFEHVARSYKDHQDTSLERNGKKRRRCNHSSTSDGEEKQPDPFLYGDVGCNEGDLTIAMAQAFHEALNGSTMKYIGVDVDDTLVSRANKKSKEIDGTINGEFVVANVCHADDFEAAFPNMVDFMSILSTTMWIHINEGDDGLRNALERICKKTKRFLLIEPQPSKCYRNAVVRLRKMGRPEMNVSTERLKIRANIEDEIQKLLRRFGFQPVEGRANGTGNDNVRTKWNRVLQLYERTARHTG